MKYKNATVKGILEAISYYYKIPVIYKGKTKNATYSGIISTKTDVTEMVRILNGVGIKARYDGKEITVTQ